MRTERADQGKPVEDRSNPHRVIQEPEPQPPGGCLAYFIPEALVSPECFAAADQQLEEVGGQLRTLDLTNDPTIGVNLSRSGLDRKGRGLAARGLRMLGARVSPHGRTYLSREEIVAHLKGHLGTVFLGEMIQRRKSLGSSPTQK